MFPWSDAQTPTSSSYAVGEPVYSGDCRGTVVSVDAGARTISVAWQDAKYGPITYPDDAGCLRKALPWEK